MEDFSKTTDSVTESVSVSSDINHLSRRPDVPEDIEDEFMNHFNDPNWDFRDNSSTLSISTDGVEAVESQRWSKMSGHTGAATEVNTESHISSWHIHDPMADLSSKDQMQLRVLSLPSCLAFRSPVSYSPGIRPTLRSGQQSRTPTTQQSP